MCVPYCVHILCMWRSYASGVDPHLLPCFEMRSHHCCICQATWFKRFWGFPVFAFNLSIADAKIATAYTVHLDFTWVLKIQTQILQFVQQLFYLLNHLLSPLLTILNCINDQFISVHWKYILIFKILGCIKLISILNFSYNSSIYLSTV